MTQGPGEPKGQIVLAAPRGSAVWSRVRDAAALSIWGSLAAKWSYCCCLLGRLTCGDSRNSFDVLNLESTQQSNNLLIPTRFGEIPVRSAAFGGS